MPAREACIVLCEIAVQHIFRKPVGPAQRFDPIEAGDGFDFRGHRTRGLLVPKYDVADEIGRRKRRRGQSKKLMARLDPMRMADLAGSDVVWAIPERNLIS